MNGFLFASDIYVEFSDAILELLVIPTITAGLLAALVLLVNLFARKWLTAGQMGLLWALVLIRLAIPYGFAPESSYSLTNLLVEFMEESTPAEPPRDAYTPEPWPVTDANSMPAAYVPPMNKIQFLEPKTPEVSFTETLQEYLITFLVWFLRILPPVWFVGALFILIRMLVTHWRFTRKINRLTAATDQRLIQLWNTCCEQVQFRRSVPLIVCDDISQPSVMGALRPKLLLPTDLTELTDNQLQLIMLHELAHLKRRDLWVNWCLFGLRLLHWWNPLYWLAATRYSSLREQSRDAMVLRWREQQDENNSESDHSREYSELLLTLAQRPDVRSRWRVSLPVSILGFLKNPLCKRSLSNRLKALRTATVQVHPLQKTLVITAIILFTASGLTDAKYTATPEPKRPLWTSGTNFEFKSVVSKSGPVTVQVYDLSKLIIRIMEDDQITESLAHEWMLLLVRNQFGFLKSSHRYHDGPFLEDSKPIAEYGEGNQLLVRAPAAWQKEIDFMLNAWGKSGMGQVTFETRTAALSKDIAKLAGFEWNRLKAFAPVEQVSFDELPGSEETVVQASAVVDEYFPIRVAVLSKEQEFQFLQIAQCDSRASMMFAPKMTSFNGQRVMLCNLIRRPYVTGLQKQADGQLQSVVETIEEGMSLTLRPVYSADRTAIHLSGLIQLSQILEVNLYVSEIQGKEVAVQVPRVFRRRISVASNLKDEQCLLICIPPSPHEKQFNYLMLKVRLNEKPIILPAPVASMPAE